MSPTGGLLLRGVQCVSPGPFPAFFAKDSAIKQPRRVRVRAEKSEKHNYRTKNKSVGVGEKNKKREKVVVWGERENDIDQNIA